MNIEKTISEHAVSDILTPMLESQDRIVTEDVAPLFDQATGLDTPPASGTVTTTIEESRSVITAIIRKAWTAPLTMLFGASVIGYITAAYTYLRNRLQGSETYGIPDRRSEISASSPLAANLALLNDRKIGGVPEAEDGMSMAHLIGTSQRLAITELTDNNEWSESVTFSDTQRIMSLFPNVESVELGIKELTYDSNNGAFTSSNLTEIKLPHLEVYNGNGLPPGYYSAIVYGTQIEELDLSSLKEINRIAYWKSNPCQIAYNCSTLKVVDLSSMTSFLTGMDSGYPGVHFQDCPNIETIKVGKVTSFNSQNFTQYTATDPMTKLVHLEFGEGTAISLNLAYWNPSVALDPNLDTLIEEGSTAANNLEQFLSNFRDYIALRLTDNGSGKTLTLSQAVRNAIHAAESTYGIENIIITQKGWTISPAPN